MKPVARLFLQLAAVTAVSWILPMNPMYLEVQGTLTQKHVFCGKDSDNSYAVFERSTGEIDTLKVEPGFYLTSTVGTGYTYGTNNPQHGGYDVLVKTARMLFTGILGFALFVYLCRRWLLQLGFAL